MTDDARLPLRATLKSGAGYDAPWLTVDGIDADDLAHKLASLMESEAIGQLIEAANLFKAANNASPLATNGPAAQAAPAAAPQQQAAPAPQAGAARLHPEGKTCGCGNVLNYKTVTRKSDGKQFNFWECPARSGRNDTVHTSEFA